MQRALSPSRAADFMQCPLLYRFRVVDRLPEETVGDGAADRARDAEIHAALRTLPQRQRAALVLRYFEDLTEAQAASVMGVATGTVKSLSHQGMTRLRAELDDRRTVEAEQVGEGR